VPARKVAVVTAPAIMMLGGLVRIESRGFGTEALRIWPLTFEADKWGLSLHVEVRGDFDVSCCWAFGRENVVHEIFPSGAFL
jgi:hypothetical protein